MYQYEGFRGGLVIKNLPVKAGDVCLTPRTGRYPGEGNRNQCQCCCLGNPMARRACGATVHGVAKYYEHNLVIKD